MSSEPIMIKLVLLGDQKVGKSCVVLRFVKDEFDPFKYPTIGATYLAQSVVLGNQQLVKFEIWDTAGQEKYRSLAPLYYHGASAALIVYDITSKESFDNAKWWVNEVQSKEGSHVVIALAGNKLDLSANRQVSTSEAQQYAQENKFIFFETSAKNDTNIKEIFKAIAEEVPHRQIPTQNQGVVLQEDTNTERKKKCACNLL
ncbi:Ras family protein [Reticulomyxa filosa]|uniref:Ras family protein n=1 Tax=Reticulomyxa filosa TaxID=46433 RepID=X6N022_RETFI|nr:Ras family protein [Reticulomyxa filosa]|eukprot:ETO19253.1 Ras family protein [Reticulomyxa filosa]